MRATCNNCKVLNAEMRSTLAQSELVIKYLSLPIRCKITRSNFVTKTCCQHFSSSTGWRVNSDKNPLCFSQFVEKENVSRVFLEHIANCKLRPRSTITKVKGDACWDSEDIQVPVFDVHILVFFGGRVRSAAAPRLWGGRFVVEWCYF